MNNNRNKLLNIAVHLGFWMLSFTVLMLIFEVSGKVTMIDFVYTIVFHFSLIPLVYLNYFLCVPKLLARQKYAWYAILIVVFTIATSLFNGLLFSRYADLIFPGYYFVSYFSFQDVLILHFIYIIISTLIVLSGGWFREIDNRKKLIEMEKEKIHSELQMLKNQVNPHFFFNTLQNLYALSLKKSDELPGMILKLSDLMRYVIYEADVPKIKLHKEIEFINNYLELQKLRVQKETVVTFEVLGNPGNIEIPPLMLIYFVENCFKHGLKGEIKNAFANITMEISTQELIFKTRNNKSSHQQNPDKKSPGTGIENVRRRLDLNYPGKYTLQVEDGDSDFQVDLKIELA